MKSSWALLALLIGSVASASTLNYQGRLTGTNGAPVNGSVAIAVKLYSQSSGGTALYTEDMGSVAVANGIFSFDWGASGTSSVMAIETIGITTGSNSVYNGTTQNKPMNSGEVAVADGTFVWTDTTGSSSPSDFLGTVSSYSNGTISAVYLSGNPPAGRVIKVAYRYPVLGCDATLQTYSNLWLGVTIDGSEMSPRRVLGAVPRSIIANTVKGQTLYVDDSTGRVGIGMNNPSSTLTVGGVIESTFGGIKFPDGTVQVTAQQATTTTVVVCDYYEIETPGYGADFGKKGPSMLSSSWAGSWQEWVASLLLPHGAKIIRLEGQAYDTSATASVRVSLLRADCAGSVWTNASFCSDPSFDGGGTNFVISSITSNVIDTANYVYHIHVATYAGSQGVKYIKAVYVK